MKEMRKQQEGGVNTPPSDVINYISKIPMITMPMNTARMHR